MNNLKYIFMILLGGIMYGTMSSFVKLSYSWGYNAAEISFTQALFASIVLGCYTLIATKGNKGSFNAKNIIPLLLTGSAIGLTNFFYYVSVNYISASLAIVVLMQFTWFSLMLEWIVFTKKPSRFECLTVFFILVGSVMASNIISHNSLFFSYKGIAFALLASLTYAVYIVANGRLGKGVNWQSKSIYIMIGSALTIFLISNRTIIFDNHFSLPFFVYAIFLAVIGTAIPTALFAIGIPKVGSGISSILMTIELPIAILCASIILGEHIDSIQIAGIIIMLASISAMNYYKSIKLLKTQKNK